MKAHLILASAATLALAACGGGDDAATANDMAANGLAADNGALATADNMADVNAAAPAPLTASTGQDYATMAAAGDMYEIESSKLVVEKSQNAELKKLAQMIIADHEKSTADLKKAAAEAQPPIMVAPALNPEQQANMTALKAANAADLDRLWVSQQIPAHEKTLGLVQHYAQNGDVAALKQHASTVSGPVQKHLDALRKMPTQ